jgi:hypothetical protein
METESNLKNLRRNLRKLGYEGKLFKGGFLRSDEEVNPF